MKTFILIMISVGVLGAVVGGALLLAQNKANALPTNNPQAFLQQPDYTKPIVVCIGDSITHGAISANYVDMLQAQLPDHRFINAGINSELAYNVLMRLDEVIACKPDFVTVLIGTNDAKALISEEYRDRSINDLGLPQQPDRDWYKANLTVICRRLRDETSARVAFLSLPTLGEDMDDAAYALGVEYSGFIKDIAGRTGAEYLPLHERMNDSLAGSEDEQKYDFREFRSLMMKAAVLRYSLGVSWDKIGKMRGFSFHTDHLHLNSQGAAMVTELIAGFVTQAN